MKRSGEQRSAQARRAVWSKRISVQCMRTSKRTSKWPSIYVSILGCSKLKCNCDKDDDNNNNDKNENDNNNNDNDENNDENDNNNDNNNNKDNNNNNNE